MSIWIQITAGRGPSECCLVVARVAAMLALQAQELGAPLHILEQVDGDRKGIYQSVIFLLDDHDAPLWLKSWLGTIQWVSTSPYRPQHRRKNWFVGVQVLQQPAAGQWSRDDVRIDTFKASGPGGQHVNKTESAVRATHLPSGLVAIAQDGRSQHENRQLAVERLKRRLQLQVEQVQNNARHQLREKHGSLERGNSVRVFSGPDFVPVK